MTSGRAAFIENGGHVVCRQEDAIIELRKGFGELWNRLFKDNGVKSIQTSLAEGAAHFKAIDEKMDRIRDDVGGLKAYVTTLADVVRQSNTMQQGIAGESLTTEGLVRQVLQQLPKGSGGSSNSAMWISLAVVAVCGTIVFLKLLAA